MSALSEAVDQYLALRRGLGAKLLHGVGLTDRPQTEIVRPPDHHLVEVAYYLVRVRSKLTALRRLTDFRTQPPDHLRRRSGTNVDFPRPWRVAAPYGVSQEVKRFVWHQAALCLPLVDRQFQPRDQSRHGTACCTCCAPTADHVIVGVIDDVSVQLLLVPSPLPTQYESAHVQVG